MRSGIWYGGHSPTMHYGGYSWHGRGGFGRSGWGHRFWHGRRGGQFGGGMFDPQVQWAQSCLAQVVDPSVPQDGRMGFQTRQAIQNFQSQQQMPPTGMLDPNTVSALQAACNPQPPTPPPPPPPPLQSQVVVPAGQSQQGGGRSQGAQHEAFLGDLLSPLLPPGLGSLFNLGGGDVGSQPPPPSQPWQPWQRPHWNRGRRWSREAESEAEFRERPVRAFARPAFGFHPDVSFHQSRDRGHWDRRGFWPGDGWGFGFGTAPGDPRIAWAQACLAQVLGSGVVQDGVFGPNTQASIRTFQQQQGLPPTGFLDDQTVNALQAGCGSQAP